jgi:hypothetical protein
MIQFEKEVLGYLNIPSIPKKEFDGKTSFAKGVAVVETVSGQEAFAIASFNPDNGDEHPKITKVFGIEPFNKVNKIFVVPAYMTTDDEIKNMDLDEQSKKKVRQVLDEAKEIENEGTKEENPMANLPEWIFEEIHSKEEAIAWLKNFQSCNKQKGRIPTTDENIKLRLFSIYSELQKKQK